jgi:signal transduction histidine kinase
VVLTDEVADLVETLKKIYRDKRLDVQCRIPPNSLFPGERNDLLELLGNLLDNACQWASHRARLTIKETDQWQQLIVEDDGPGAPLEQLERLTLRGARIDESRSGHGLGLAIVNDIAEQYGGRLHLGRSQDLGGFLAEVELPAI